MASQKLLLLLLLCVMAGAVSAKTVYISWSLGISYQTIYLNVGDSVVFGYTSGTHTVLAIYDQNDYDNCNTGAVSATYTSGQDYISFSYAGTFFFICGVENHCWDGMKVTIVAQ